MVYGRTQRLVRLSALISLALIIWVVEASIPLPVLIPGAKLGLANAIALWCLITLGFKDALVVNIMRAVIGSLLTGTFMSLTFFLSLSGGIASVLMMGLLWLACRRWLSLIGVSLAGAFVHNFVQVITAAALMRHAGILMYLPHLLLFALPTGFFVGLVVYHLKAVSLWKQWALNSGGVELVKRRGVETAPGMVWGQASSGHPSGQDGRTTYLGHRGPTS